MLCLLIHAYTHTRTHAYTPTRTHGDAHTPTRTHAYTYTRTYIYSVVVTVCLEADTPLQVGTPVNKCLQAGGADFFHLNFGGSFGEIDLTVLSSTDWGGDVSSAFLQVLQTSAVSEVVIPGTHIFRSSGPFFRREIKSVIFCLYIYTCIVAHKYTYVYVHT